MPRSDFGVRKNNQTTTQQITLFKLK